MTREQPPPAEARYLNVGCGEKPLPGFINLDRRGPHADVRRDVRRGLPFPDGSLHAIYSEHFLEHLTQAEGMRFLRECRRALAPGGCLRIAMPDLDDLVSRYSSEDWRGDGDMFRLGYDWISTRCEMLNLAMREWGHKHVYNQEELSRLAHLAGLRDGERRSRGESPHPHLRDLETRPASKLIMEFTRPLATPSATPPLVSILIPAYNPRFFPDALRSALSQDYPALEVLICDDSPTDEIEHAVRELAAGRDHVCYHRNRPRRGGLLNYPRCLELAGGEYVKFLNDDDLLEPSAVTRLAASLEGRPHLELATSGRRCIDETGQVISPRGIARLPFHDDVEIHGGDLATSMVCLHLNLVGEPSTAMFRRDAATRLVPHLMSFGGVPVRGIGDIALWLNLLGQGHAAYLAAPCSSFRLHAGQQQRKPEIRAMARAGWRHLELHADRLGLLCNHRGWSVRARTGPGAPWRRKVIVSPGRVARQSARRLVELARARLSRSPRARAWYRRFFKGRG